ncbi:MAG: chemotaxis response regulator protein-glutamate methylesterase [Alphaproteobacteria bacterium]|nr:chemotaxis response regulator protein-glutamate methylesterase [Alphaproteobacteria bacterium]
MCPVFSSKDQASDASRIRVMVVDDSLVIRGFITRALESDLRFRVVATASNGQIALDILRRISADVIILDIEMPVMDGLTAIPKLKEIDPSVQIVMASTLTQKNAEVSLKAMSLGATDYLPKPSAREMAVPNAFQHELREKVGELASLARKARALKTGQRPALEKPERHIKFRPMPSIKPEVIAIGSSTGGPQALFEVIVKIGKGLSQPIVITQHMPPSLTTILADHIAKQCAVDCIEAKDGDILEPGRFHIAPGDFHMLFVGGSPAPKIRLVKDPPENWCRPSVDPMLRSLVGVYGGRILTVILTGMGQDGMKGSDNVVKAGGAVIAQDEKTSVVWGMPGAVAEAGLCSAVVPLHEIGAMVRRIAQNSNRPEGV